MKIAIRGGHNPSCGGAVALLNELTEDRKVYAEVMNYLRQVGHTVIDCTPSPTSSQGADLSYGVNKANNEGVDLFISIHFNKAYDSYDGAIGSEVWGYPNDNNGITISNRILSNLQDLGFKNRGWKNGKEKGLYEINKTSMTGLIVEVCFVEATKDVELYNKLGYKRVALAIAEGIHGGKIVKETPIQEKPKKYWVITDYLPQGEYGLAIKDVMSKYFYDIQGELYVRTNDTKGQWIETCYLPLEKCEELQSRLGKYFWEIKSH